MNVTIAFRASDATQWAGETEAFAAWVEACAAYPDWAFRIRSGGEPGFFRVEAWKLCKAESGWLRLEP